jgi:hypothetical protein
VRIEARDESTRHEEETTAKANAKEKTPIRKKQMQKP